MGKVKVIPQRYVEQIVKHSPHALLISTHYVNQDTIIDVYCKKHKIIYSKPLKNLLRHNGCEQCTHDLISQYRSYTTEEFKEMVHKKNPHIEVLGEYTGQGCKILCKCLIHNIEFFPISQSLIRGKGGCPICNLKRPQRRTSEELKRCFHQLNPTLKIMDEHIRLNTSVKIYCTVCGQYFNKTLTSDLTIDKQCSCLVCINRVIVKGFNDVATIRPDLVKYFKNKDEAYRYGPGMTKKLTFICPDCGYEKELRVEVLSREGFGCPCCGDGISYPNKFVRSLLRQLKVDNLSFEYSPTWAKPYFYDCYFDDNGHKYIIEVDGQQHFKKSSNFAMTLAEVQKRDQEKTFLAESNGYIVIHINASKSNKDYLSCQIHNSLLSTLFDLHNIDWDKCDMDATSNLAKEICMYAEQTMPDKYQPICEKFHICGDTIRKYLKQGIKYGWCSDRTLEKITVPKRVSVYDKGNNLLYIFNGIQTCSTEMSKIYTDDFNIHGISDNCHGLRDSYKDYIFKFTYNTM